MKQILFRSWHKFVARVVIPKTVAQCYGPAMLRIAFAALLLSACKPSSSLPEPPPPPPTTVSAPAGSAVIEKEQLGAQRLLEVRGHVQVDGTNATADTSVGKDSLIVTAADGHAVLTVLPGSAIAIHPNTHVRLGHSQRAAWSLQLVAGALLNFLPQGASYEVVTDNAIAGVRGTRFFAQASGPSSSYVCACQGDVQMTASVGGFNQLVQATASNPHRGHTFVRNEGAIAVSPAPQHNHGPAEEQALERWFK